MLKSWFLPPSAIDGADVYDFDQFVDFKQKEPIRLEGSFGQTLTAYVDQSEENEKCLLALSFMTPDVMELFEMYFGTSSLVSKNGKVVILTRRNLYKDDAYKRTMEGMRKLAEKLRRQAELRRSTTLVRPKAYNRYMKHTMRGMNLGGWLVIEKWMTPSLFDGVSARNEFELSKTAQGRERIEKHHRNFITVQDLRWLKARDVEILRIPIGYWVFGDDDRYVGAIERLDWLMATSLSLGFKVLLDLHAAPGAQNRAAHSGSGNTVSDKHSTKWLNDIDSQEKTIEVLEKLAARYRHFSHVWGIELLNEPAVDFLGLKLARFYRTAYKRVIKVARPGTHIVFSDGYAPLRLTNCLWLLKKREFPVVMDVHIYQVFGSRNKQKTYGRHIAQLAWTRWFLKIIRLNQPIIVGEWSAMLPLKTNGSETTRYVTAQLKAFEGSLAQFYWNYKTESEGRWNYRDQAGKELLQ